MVLYNLGSVADRVYALVDNIPTGISGALINIANDQRIFIEQYTGLNVGSVDIAERFQPALVALTAGNTQMFVEAQGSDKSFTLGDLHVQRTTFNDSASNAFTLDGMTKLKRIGRQFGVRKTFG